MTGIDKHVFTGSLLLEEIVNTYDGEGMDVIIEGAQKRFSESCHAKIAGSADWWRVSRPFFALL